MTHRGTLLHLFSQITSIGFQNKAMTSNVALSDAMATTSKTMGDMNKIMNPQAIGKNLRDFQAANMKMEMTDEMSKRRHISYQRYH